MKRHVLAALLCSATASYAGSVATTADPGSDVSSTRNMRRGGGYDSQWTAPSARGNARDHEGRGAGSFEDGGRGIIRLGVKADADGKAVVVFQDVGDTKNFRSFRVNGEKIDVPKPSGNGSILRVLLDFGGAGWHRVVAATTLAHPRSGQQDGFSVCRH